ncbi:MAG: protease complex subunit PrcB family protein [Phycisphaerales bacterium]|nr:protease complex subunit PrcB family protein [Phycisphaerales bacterium]
MLLGGSCAPKVSSVHGWSGPETSVVVDRSGAQITLMCPTGGWEISIDRVERSGETARVYLTALRPEGMVTQAFTPRHVDWKPESGPAPQCVQALIRLDTAQWLPAAEACR